MIKNINLIESKDGLKHPFFIEQQKNSFEKENSNVIFVNDLRFFCFY